LLFERPPIKDRWPRAFSAADVRLICRPAATVKPSASLGKKMAASQGRGHGGRVVIPEKDISFPMQGKG
jgi:hypothetical protein